MSEPAPEQTSSKARHEARGPGIHARRESRLHTPDLECSMGKVADLTGSGMRMIVPKNELPEIGDVQSYTFSDLLDSVTVTGTVKWIRKGCAFSRRCEVGVEFVTLDQGVRDSIVRLAVHGKLREPGAGAVKFRAADLYSVLGVTRYASEEQIDEAFDSCCRRWGEDSDDRDAPAKLDAACKAYAVLSDEERRAKYDLRFADQHERAA